MDAYAVIETGGKQYTVKEGDILEVELLGSSGAVTFDKVLLVHNGNALKLGQPHLQGGVVHAELLGVVKGPKVIASKYRACKNYRRTVGHRQRYSRVKITKIAAG